MAETVISLRRSQNQSIQATAAALTLFMLFGFAPSARAGMISGMLRMVGGVLEIPRSVVAGTVQGPFMMGTLAGAVTGVVRSVGLITSGALETGASAAGTALRYAPIIPIFL